jgi:hypothetical protein
MQDNQAIDLVELKEIRTSIDHIIECCAEGQIDRNEMIAQIWLQFVFIDLQPQILH